MPTGTCLCGEIRIEYTGEPVFKVSMRPQFCGEQGLLLISTGYMCNVKSCPMCLSELSANGTFSQSTAMTAEK